MAKPRPPKNKKVILSTSAYQIKAATKVSNSGPSSDQIEGFIHKWEKSSLNEQQGAQQHFLELCQLFRLPTPEGNDYLFEKHITKPGGRKGRADVWKKHHFAWEYKTKGEDFKKAFEQLYQYLPALDNPPLLIVCDMVHFELRTNWNNHVTQVLKYTFNDFYTLEFQNVLKSIFENPEQLKPQQTTEKLTEDSVAGFIQIAKSLEQRISNPLQVAHFLNKLVFCMFAESIGLLPDHCFSKSLESAQDQPETLESLFSDLFAKMAKGGHFGAVRIDYFNGGLFSDNDVVLSLNKAEIVLLTEISRHNWKEIDPTIFGTLFERTIDPQKRRSLGTHYTSSSKIAKIVQPVVILPLQLEWDEIKSKIGILLAKKNKKAAIALYETFMQRLQKYKVLDPACGSGNFLYQALKELKSFNHRVVLEAQDLGIETRPLVDTLNISPNNVCGIEKEVYAAELARLVIWIGEIQWMISAGFGIQRKPILQKLDNIECRDALINEDGSEAQWPVCDAIVGNPPFLGCKKLEFGLNCHSEISPMNQSENDLIRHLLLIGIYSGV